MPKHVIIIGGGVGGLSAAIRLAAAGRRVTLLEKNPRVGGKLNLWQVPHPGRTNSGGATAAAGRDSRERPFRFDTGPSLLTLPFVFEELLAVAGVKLADVLSLKRLDPIARFVWGDGTQFELRSDPADRLAEIDRFSPADRAGWERFCARGKKIWDLTADLFLYHAPEQVIRRGGKFDPAAALKMLATPFRIGMFSRFASAVDGPIKNQKLREVLYQYATYSGASPFRAPATLAVIPHAEMHFGGWYPEGGMYKIAEALEVVARRLGVEIRLNSPVERILVEPGGGSAARWDADRAATLATVGTSKSASAQRSRSGKKPRPRVAGVRLVGGEEIRADAVVANSDLVYTYRKLIDPQWRPRFPDARLNRIDPGGSGMILMLGVEGTYPQLAHHTKFMPDDYRGDLTAMFESHTTPDDPCIYVCASTRTDPTQAPQGCENLFVLASAPALAPGEEGAGESESSSDNGRGSSPIRGDGPDDGAGDGANFGSARSDAKSDNSNAPNIGNTDIANSDTAHWRSLGQAYRDRLLATLEKKWGLTDLRKRIVVERRMSPADLQSAYNANAGSIYGIGGNSRRAAFLRPPNRDATIAGLYFAGGATHPGGGLPLVALSGKIVSELVMEDF